jgi:hypothetical protein
LNCDECTLETVYEREEKRREEDKVGEGNVTCG